MLQYDKQDREFLRVMREDLEAIIGEGPAGAAIMEIPKEDQIEDVAHAVIALLAFLEHGERP